MLSLTMSTQWRNFLLVVALAACEAAGHLVFPSKWAVLIGPLLILVAGAIRSYLPHTSPPVAISAVTGAAPMMGVERFCKKCGVVLGATLLFLLALAGCDAFRAAVPAVATVAACILDHDTLSPEEIAKECGGLTATEVITVLNASRRSQVRRMLRDGADAGPRDAGAE